MFDAQQDDAKVTAIKMISSVADKSLVFYHHTSIAAAIFIPSSLFMSLKNFIEAQVFDDVMQHKLCKRRRASPMCALNSEGFTPPLMSSVLVFIRLLKIIRLNLFSLFLN